MTQRKLLLTEKELTMVRLAVSYHLELPTQGDGVTGKDRSALIRAYAKLGIELAAKVEGGR